MRYVVSASMMITAIIHLVPIAGVLDAGICRCPREPLSTTPTFPFSCAIVLSCLVCLVDRRLQHAAPSDHHRRPDRAGLPDDRMCPLLSFKMASLKPCSEMF